MTLFEHQATRQIKNNAPLASRIRPTNFDKVETGDANGYPTEDVEVDLSGMQGSWVTNFVSTTARPPGLIVQRREV